MVFIVFSFYSTCCSAGLNTPSPFSPRKSKRLLLVLFPRQLSSSARSKDIKLSSAMLQRNFYDAAKKMIKWSLKVCTKRFPKIGRHGQHRIQRCSVYMNKKQTILQIWKFWITSTMSWHWKLTCNFEVARKISGAWSTRQIQAHRAKDVDVMLQAEYWVLIQPAISRRGCLTRSKHIDHLSRVLGIDLNLTMYLITLADLG